MKRGMIFVQGKDRPGIIKTVSGILYKAGANLEDVSMTLLEGQFAMMMSFQAKSIEVLEKKIALLRKSPWNLYANIISVSAQLTKANVPPKSILITAIGKDRTGIVNRLSSDLSAISANITNLDCRILRGGKSALYSLVLEVDLKKASDEKKIFKLAKVWEKKIGIEVKAHISESAVF